MSFSLRRGHQRAVFPDLLARIDRRETQQLLSIGGLFADRQRPFQLAAQQHDAPLAAPAVKAQFNGLTLPTVARLGPGTIHRPLDRAPHVGGQADAEQIGQSALFRFAHDGFVAPAGVAAQQARPALPSQPVQQGPQAGRAVLRGVWLPCDLDIQHTASDWRSDNCGSCARDGRACRIVANHRAFLVAKQGFDGGIDVRIQGSRSNGAMT